VTYTYAKTGALLTEENENLATSYIFAAVGQVITETEINDIGLVLPSLRHH